jgi:hypothetical protein
MLTAANRRIAARSRIAGGLRALVASGVVAIAGCRPGPDITVAGSYFPAWMVAFTIGVLGTVVCWQLFSRVGIDPYLAPRSLVYAGLVILITVVVWLGVFHG